MQVACFEVLAAAAWTGIVAAILVRRRRHGLCPRGDAQGVVNFADLLLGEKLV